MKNILFVSLIILGLASFGCATATHQGINLNKITKEEVEAYNNDPNNIDKIVCVKETPIGTRVPKRVCRMQSSIDERARQDQRETQKIQSGVITQTPK